MATELRLRRGTTAEHENFTGAQAEVTVDTDKNTVIVHDGSTAGGYPVLSEHSGALTADSIKDLPTSVNDGDTVFVKSYHSDVEGGGGVFVYDSTADKATHNGGTIIDTDVVFPTDWSDTTQQTTWFTAGTGTGCWIRKYDGAVNVKWFGAKGDGTTDDTLAIQKVMDNYSTIFIPNGTFKAEGLNNSVNKHVEIHGESQDAVIQNITDHGTILTVGDPSDSWGAGGSIKIFNLVLQGQSDWASITGGSETVGLVEIYNVARLHFDNVSITYSPNTGLYVNNLGYSHISNSQVKACRFDCVFLDSTDVNNAVTSTHITNCNISTGLQSSVHLNNVLNITIEKCQCEDSETALLINGNDNRSIVYRENYVEATRGDYDVTIDGNGVNFTFVDNYLFGTPDIKSVYILDPTSAQRITWANNQGASIDNNTQLSSVEWLKGSRSKTGSATNVLTVSSDAAQRVATAEIRLDEASDDYGTAIRTFSTSGDYRMGLLRGSGFNDSDDKVDAYFTQRFDNSGAINTTPDGAYALHVFGGAGYARNSLKCSHVGGTVFNTGGLGYTMTGTPNSTQAALFVYQPNVGGRSINASGTINASGADYAEYEINNGLDIAKGDIVGFKEDGTLTNKFSESFRFGIKSTKPAYVGGDTWGRSDVIGEEPKEPSIIDFDLESEYEEALSIYNTEYSAWKDRLEAERVKVDRIAYSGKVPLNYTGASVGNYIIASSGNNDEITPKEVSKDALQFSEYLYVVGRVNKILADGRCEVAVIIH